MPKIAIIGDVMLDTYHSVEIVREAPEGGFIYRITHTDYRPGAAANIADCLETLGWDVTLYAHISADRDSNILRGWAHACGIQAYWLALEKNEALRVNTRYLFEKKCLLRADTISPKNWYWGDFDMKTLAKMDAVVLYDKGSLQFIANDILAFCHQHKIKTYVDPYRHQASYTQSYLIKANATEFKYLNAELTGDAIKQQYAWQHLIVTNEHDSISYWDHEHQHYSIKTQPCVHPLDPMGAGDAFFSTFITAEHAGNSFLESINYAQLAGSIAVQHSGTYAPTLSELKLKLKENK